MTVIVKCPNCGEEVVVNGLGRQCLNLGVKNIYNALRDSATVSEAASKLGCSRGYIYHELAKQGTTPRKVLMTKQGYTFVENTNNPQKEALGNDV